MNAKRLPLLLLLAALVLLATGCEWMRWLRLLSMKKQFAEVERYVRVDDHDGLTLHFLKPVVYAEDLSLLIADETSRTTNQNQMTWVWTYEKQSLGTNAESGSFDVSASILFENQKFSELRFPSRILTLMPKPLIIGLLRSVGQAEIDMKHGSVKMKWVGPGPNQKVDLPRRSQVLAMLGAPFLLTESNRTQTLLYKFYQKVSSPLSPAERLAWAKFTFAPDGEQMLSSEGGFGNLGWNMTRPSAQAEPLVTISLLPLSVEPVAIQLPPQLAATYVGQYRGPDGKVLHLGFDAGVFVLSWNHGDQRGWCPLLPELTNTLFVPPSGFPRFSVIQAGGGSITGLLEQERGPDTFFARLSTPLPGMTESANPASTPPPEWTGQGSQSLPPIVPLSTNAAAACTGRYKASWGGLITISREGEQLFWQNQGIRARLPLYPASETNFFFKTVDSPLTFVQDDQGRVTKFILHYCGKQSEAVKVK